MVKGQRLSWFIYVVAKGKGSANYVRKQQTISFTFGVYMLPMVVTIRQNVKMKKIAFLISILSQKNLSIKEKAAEIKPNTWLRNFLSLDNSKQTKQRPSSFFFFTIKNNLNKENY